jgi:hypothetical protein
MEGTGNHIFGSDAIPGQWEIDLIYSEDPQGTE